METRYYVDSEVGEFFRVFKSLDEAENYFNKIPKHLSGSRIIYKVLGKEFSTIKEDK